jgi:hypothetical protein
MQMTKTHVGLWCQKKKKRRRKRNPIDVFNATNTEKLLREFRMNVAVGG